MLVCENHPDKAWPDECDCGAGMYPEPSKMDRAKWLYEEMLMTDTYSRHSVVGQAMLSFMRDFIADAEGREPQDVQDEYEASWLRMNATNG